MVKCWASILGDCSDKQSREHIISKGILREFSYPNLLKVKLYGIGIPDGVRDIGTSALTAKMLCTKHNAELSLLDQAAIKALYAFDKMALFLKNSRTQSKVEPSNVTFSIDGLLLERWFLKTTINLLYNPPHNIKYIPAELIEIVFGLRKYPTGTGLCIAGKAGMQLTAFEGDLMFLPLVNSDGQTEIVAFKYSGWKFALPLTEAPLPVQLKITPDNEHNPGEDFALEISKCNLIYHIQDINLRLGDSRTATIHFSWN